MISESLMINTTLTELWLDGDDKMMENETEMGRKRV